MNDNLRDMATLSRRLSRRAGLVFILFASAIFLLSGCTTVKIEGLRLLSPKFPSSVDSLQPEFRWEAAAGSTYDLGIWKLREKPYSMTMGACGEAFHHGTLWELQSKTPFYYGENLKENVHRVATPLEPANCYAWSVRRRTGDVPDKWSTISETDWMGAGKSWAIGRFEMFRTLRK